MYENVFCWEKERNRDKDGNSSLLRCSKKANNHLDKDVNIKGNA